MYDLHVIFCIPYISHILLIILNYIAICIVQYCERPSDLLNCTYINNSMILYDQLFTRGDFIAILSEIWKISAVLYFRDLDFRVYMTESAISIYFADQSHVLQIHKNIIPSKITGYTTLHVCLSFYICVIIYRRFLIYSIVLNVCS